MKENTIILIRNAKAYDFGGGERFPVFLAEILQQHNFSPLLVSRSKKLRDFATQQSIPSVKGWWWSWQNWSGPFILLTPLYVVWQLLLFIWYFALFIRKKPHAVHVQSKDDFIAATLAAKLYGARIIWTDHADLKHIWRNVRVWYKNPIGKMIYLAGLQANTITVVSDSERCLVTGHLSSKSSLLPKITVIYNGSVDTIDQYKHLQKKTPFTFCVASRLVKDKGIREVISAYSKLSSKYPDTKLVLMGDGPEKDIFTKQAANNPQISFLGHTPNPLEYIANADVFVHPTYHEGFSVALVEASMLGKPIIATAVGGNVEIIHNDETGLLVEPRDTQSLLAAMERLLSDAALRNKLSKNARKQYEERFDFNEIVASSFIPLYKGAKN